MTVNIGIVTTVKERFVDVMLKNPAQLIKNVVKVSPLNLDEREQKPMIKVGTEILVFTDDWNNSYAVGSISQGIAIIGEKVSRIENDKVRVITKTINITNGSDEIVQILLDFMDAMGTCLTGGSQVPHNKATEVMALKSKLEAFKE